MLLLLLTACAVGTPSPTPDPPPPPPAPVRSAASWIRIGWGGATGRTEADATALAEAVHNDATHGASFPALARRWSEHPSGRHGGWLGAFDPGTLDPRVEAAVAAATPGGVGPLVHLDDAVVVVRRDPLDELDVAWAEWTWKGARGAASSRPHADATRLARDAAIAWRAGSAPEGADLGSSGERLGRSQWPPSLEARVDRLAPGEVSDPIETPWGVLVVRRGAAP